MAHDRPSPGKSASVDKIIYEKPIIEEQEGLVFPEEIWKEFNEGNWCFGCSNCNCN